MYAEIGIFFSRETQPREKRDFCRHTHYATHLHKEFRWKKNIKTPKRNLASIPTSKQTLATPPPPPDPLPLRWCSHPCRLWPFPRWIHRRGGHCHRTATHPCIHLSSISFSSPPTASLSSSPTSLPSSSSSCQRRRQWRPRRVWAARPSPLSPPSPSPRSSQREGVAATVAAMAGGLWRS